MSKVRKFAIGTAAAAVAGYLAGILTAPKSGKETRGDIKDAATQTYREAEKQLKKMHTELDGLIDQAKERSKSLNDRTRSELDGLIDKSRMTKEKVRDMLSALHEGNADDKDLRKAIEEASRALDHLRTYLSK